MSNLDYDRIEKIINNFANKSLRTVLLAYADLNDFRAYKQENFDNFNFLAIVGLKDPLRPEIPQAVKQFAQSRIRIIMVTGDNLGNSMNSTYLFLETAISIAKDAKLLPKSYEKSDSNFHAIEGHYLEQCVGGLEKIPG